MEEQEMIMVQGYEVKQGYVLHLGGHKYAPGGTVLETLPKSVIENQGWKIQPTVIVKPAPVPLIPPRDMRHPVTLKDGAWAGRRCFILGGGPSLAGVDISRLEGELTIGINRALELLDPTMIFSMDSRFYMWLRSGEFGQEVIRKYVDSPAWKIWMNTHGFKFGPEVQTIEATDLPRGLSIHDGITQGANSGLMALKVAVALGADPIYLLGFDLHPNGKFQKWWHDGYKYVQKDSVYESFLEEFEAFAPEAEKRGVRVTNCNPDSALRCFEFGEMPAPTPGPLFISCFTPGLYTEKAKTLRLSLHRLGLDYRLVQVEDRGSWDANTKQKAEFILLMMETTGRDVVWLDADAIVRSYPDLFWNIEGDVALHYRNRQELLSGTMFFRNNRRSRSLLKSWIKENENNPEEWDQLILQRVIESKRGVWAPRIHHLPATYCQIFDSMKEAGEPVVEHFQASREAKRLP